jgi:uroporphyrinogen-III synthase
MRRVLVTRPQPDADRTAARLAGRGHEAVVAPVTAIAPTGLPRPHGDVDAIILTSAHAVPALTPGDLPVFAVGARTAAAARQAGFREVHAAEGDALALAELVRRTVPQGGTLLHPTARHRKAEPEATLTAAGYAVHVWETYEASAASALPDPVPHLLGAGRIDAALHYSRRSLAILVDLIEGGGLLVPFTALAHICLSADVAAPLSDLGITPVIAAEPREDALFAALDAVAGAPESPRPEG